MKNKIHVFFAIFSAIFAGASFDNGICFTIQMLCVTYNLWAAGFFEGETK